MSVPADEFDLEGGFDRSGESAALAAADRRVRGNLVAMAGWSGAANDAAADAADRTAATAATPPRRTATPTASASAAPTEAARKLRLRFWLRPVEIEKSADGTVGGLRLERTRLTESGEFEGTGEFETIDVQMVLRSVGYQSVPLPGVPFDPKSHTVPNAAGRVLSETGEPLPGEYVAGWLKRGPTGVIGTNKADAAETVQALLADLAGGPAPGETALPRPGLLRLPDAFAAQPAGPADANAAGRGRPGRRRRRHRRRPGRRGRRGRGRGRGRGRRRGRGRGLGAGRAAGRPRRRPRHLRGLAPRLRRRRGAGPLPRPGRPGQAPAPRRRLVRRPRIATARRRSPLHPPWHRPAQFFR